MREEFIYLEMGMRMRMERLEKGGGGRIKGGKGGRGEREDGG